MNKAEQDPSRAIRKLNLAGFAVIVLLVGGVGGWAVISELQGAVIAPGTLVVESNIKKVQHPTGGKRRRIMSNPLAFQFPFDASGALYTSERDGDSWRVSNAFWEPVDSQLKAHKHHTHGHLGEDWIPEKGPINAPLYAVADGKVVYAQFHPQFGLTVIIEHDVSGNEGLNNVQTVYSLYAHLEAIDTDVVVNATVDAGDPIGILGGTGKGAVGEDGNSHPHLHLEIFSGNWQTYINGGSGLYGYAEYGPTPPIGWYEPSEFIISLATCTVKQSTIPGISRPIRR